MSRRKVFLSGMKDGIPIGLGYFAVAFALGITAYNIGFNAIQAFVASISCTASAGEYAAFAVIGAGGSFAELAVIELVSNARYLLLSCTLSQKIDPSLPIWHRLLMSHGITDEIFAINIAREGNADPFYSYGAMLVSQPAWALGTAIGVIVGNILPEIVVTALSVAIYGMFIAIIIPAAKKEKVVAGIVVVCFVLSTLFSKLSIFGSISSGVKIIILTVVISAAAAVMFPVEVRDE